MNFDLILIWQQWLAGFWHPKMPYLLAMVAVLGALLFYFQREHRDVLQRTLAFYGVSLAGLGVSAVVTALDPDRDAQLGNDGDSQRPPDARQVEILAKIRSFFGLTQT